MQFSTDWTERVGQLNAYVASQYAAMDTSGSTPKKVLEYLYRELLDTPGYDVEDGDVSILRKAVTRIMAED